MKRIAAVGMLGLAMLTLGCQVPGKVEPGYATLAREPTRDTETARQANAAASQLIKDGKLQQAEETLKKGLKADLFFGPAHNNLGVVYFRQKKYYLAAWEFQYAAQLMPTKAEPRNNIGMVMEAVGKLQDAAKSYEEALKLEPEAVEVMGNLARILVRTSHNDSKTRQLLGEVVLRDQRPDWVNWARERLALMGKEPATQPADGDQPR